MLRMLSLEISLTNQNNINSKKISINFTDILLYMKLHSTPENLQVLYEDNHVIVVNKRAGDIVQGDNTGAVSYTHLTLPTIYSV